MDPLQDTAEPVSQAKCHLWKHRERTEKAKKRVGFEERMINIRGNTKVRGGGAPPDTADYPL